MIALLLVCAVGPFVKAVDAHGNPLPEHAVARLGVPIGRHHLSGLPVLSLDGRRAVAVEDGRLMEHDTRTGSRTPYAGLVPGQARPVAFVRNRLICRSGPVGWFVDP